MRQPSTHIGPLPTAPADLDRLRRIHADIPGCRTITADTYAMLTASGFEPDDFEIVYVAEPIGTTA